MAKKRPTKPATSSTPPRIPRQKKASAARTRTGHWKAKFLTLLAEVADVTRACESAGVDRKTAYNHKHADAAFAKAWDDALEESIERLEAEMRRRAVEGVDRPIFYEGVQIGVEKHYSDTLAIFLAKAHRPEKYRERVSVKHEQPAARKPIDPAAAAAAIAGVLGALESGTDDSGARDGGPDPAAGR